MICLEVIVSCLNKIVDIRIDFILQVNLDVIHRSCQLLWAMPGKAAAEPALFCFVCLNVRHGLFLPEGIEDRLLLPGKRVVAFKREHILQWDCHVADANAA